MVFALMCGTGSVAGATYQRAVNAVPAEGVFETCPLDTAFSVCASRLAVMKTGGVQVVTISAMGVSLTSLSRYAATAHRIGMSVMWEIGDPNWWRQPPNSSQLATDLPQFAAACGCSQNRDLLTYVVDWLRAQPGTYGYYAADDTALGTGDETGIAAYVARIKQLDPYHPAMIGAFSGHQQQTYAAMADLIGREIYPVTTAPILPRHRHAGTWADVKRVATAAQLSADRAGKSSAFILQAFSWGDNVSDGEAVGVCSSRDTLATCGARLRYPSGAEQLALRNAVLSAAHPALILWYSFPGTYGSAAPDTNSVYPSGADAAARWAGLSAAIQARSPRARANPHLVASRRHGNRPHVPRSGRSRRW